ncbi:DUF1877 family protein [Rathayibacter sp. CAU 1779]
MGIRYYAYPVAECDLDAARADPYKFLGGDPLMDAWGPLEEKPEMLYMDKCWGDLQHFFRPDPGGLSEPAFALVEGAVTPHGLGWYGYTKVMTPDEVAVVSQHLGTFSEETVRRRIEDLHLDRWGGGEDEEFAYMMPYIRDAQRFTAALAENRSGLVYLIG